jgi:hypothetical protein
MSELNYIGQLSTRSMKTLITIGTIVLAMGSPLGQTAQAQSLTGATTPQPEFTRGGGGCTQFGRVDAGRANAAEAVDRVLQELIMRRCVMEGVPVTTAEEDRIYPLIKALVSGVRASLGDAAATKGRYDTFLAGVRPILDAKRMTRVEAHVAAALASNMAPRPSDGTQMIQENQLVGGGQMLQPEFRRGKGCLVFGTTEAGKVSRRIKQDVSNAVLQSVFRRCLLENVSLTAAEDERLFPALKAVAQGPGRRQYQRFAEVARQTLGPARAARVEANVAQIVKGL